MDFRFKLNRFVQDRKKNTLIIFVILLAGVGIYFWLWPSYTPRYLASLAPTIDLACRKHFDKILQTDLSPYRRDSSKHLFDFAIPNAQQFVTLLLKASENDKCNWQNQDQEIRQLHQKYLESCHEIKTLLKKNPKGDLFKPLYRCFKKWALYRHHISSNLLTNDHSLTISDISLLENSLIPTLINGTEADLEKVAASAKTLSELSQDKSNFRLAFLAKKVALQIHYVQWSKGKTKANEQALKNSWRTVFEINPKDPLLGEIELGRYRLASDLVGLKVTATQLMNDRTDLTTGAYYRAWAEYLLGDKKKAEWFLKLILIYHPSDPRTLHTLTALNNKRFLGRDESPFVDSGLSLASMNFSWAEKRY